MATLQVANQASPAAVGANFGVATGTVHSQLRPFPRWRYENTNQDNCFLEGGTIAASLWDSGLNERRS
jgi:hypothetical protein